MPGISWKDIEADLGGSDSAPEAQQDTSTPTTASVSWRDLEAGLNEERRPSFADGSTPDTPTVESSLNAYSRYQLASGNEAGNLEWLTNKFGEAKKNSRGEIVYKEDGIWKPLDEKDAYTMSAGIKDVADVLPLAVQGAVSGLVTATAAAAGLLTAPATGGVSIPAAAATAAVGMGSGKLVNNTLGKHWGTYKANPGEEAAEIGLEMLFSYGMARLLPPGTRPTATEIGKRLEEAGPTLEARAKANPEMSLKMKRGMAALWDTSEDVVGHMGGSRASVIGKKLADFGDDASEEQIKTKLRDATAKHVSNVAARAQKVASRAMELNENLALKLTGDTFKTSGDDLVMDEAIRLQRANLIRLVKENGEDAVESELRSGATKLKILPVTAKEFQEANASLAVHTESVNLSRQLAGYLQALAGKRQYVGSKGAKEALDAVRVFKNNIRSLENQALESEAINFKKFMGDVSEGVMNRFSSSMSPSSQAVMQRANAIYKERKVVWGPFMEYLSTMNGKNPGKLDIRNSFVDLITHKKNPTAWQYQNAIADMARVAESTGDKDSARVLKNSLMSIKDNQALSAIAPFLKPQQGKVIAIGRATWGLLSGNVPWAVSMAGPIGALSPRAGFSAMNSMRGLRAALGNFVDRAGRPVEKLNKAFWETPGLANTALTAVFNAGRMDEQTANALQQHAESRINSMIQQGGGGQQ